MKAIRRSIKNEKDNPRSSHQSKPSLHYKSASAIIPPRKVIKALYDYEPAGKNAGELAFRKGDFFHVISREDDKEWYEACNPLIPSATGLVPVAFFEVIGKQHRASGQSQLSSSGHDSGFSEQGFSTAPTLIDGDGSISPAKPVKMHSRGPSSARGASMVYGIVLYDFAAERADELEAKTGEPIIIVAQSNPEWFVAKPIGRLGGPGLIPVSFVEIKDTVTGKPVPDALAAVRAAGVPRVEEWKKTAAEYKNNSISLGQINTPQIGGGVANVSRPQQILQGMDRLSMSNQPNNKKQPALPSQQMQQRQHAQPIQQSQPPSELLAPVKASVPRYCFDHDMYWYIIEAQMSDGRWWELSRYYADFYDFQIALLKKFPAEAGQTPGQARTLPFMPGPVAHVTDAISNGRRQNLDEYIKKIVEQPDYIREDILVRKLFAPKPNQDYEIDPSALEDDYRLSGHTLAQTQSRQSSGAGSLQQGGPMPPLPQGALRAPTHQQRPSQSHIVNDGLQMPPPLHSQASTLTQQSSGTTGSANAPEDGAFGMKLKPALRVKLEFEKDTYAIRVQEDIGFTDFTTKVRERFRIVPGVEIGMDYLDDDRGTAVTLDDEDSWGRAKCQRNIRVQLHYKTS